MGRHTKIVINYPTWIDQESDRNPCLASVAYDAYYAMSLAQLYDAEHVPACQEVLVAAKKSMAVLEDRRASVGKRCAAGDRAARKYWEAKVCARQHRRPGRKAA